MYESNNDTVNHTSVKIFGLGPNSTPKANSRIEVCLSSYIQFLGTLFIRGTTNTPFTPMNEHRERELFKILSSGPYDNLTYNGRAKIGT